MLNQGEVVCKMSAQFVCKRSNMQHEEYVDYYTPEVVYDQNQ